MNRYVKAGLILAAAVVSCAVGLGGGASSAAAQDRSMGGLPAQDRGLFQQKVVVPPGNAAVVQPSTKIIAPGGRPIPISPYSYRAYSAYSYVHPVVPGAPAPPRMWVQGYWAQQWVPQYYTYNVWVPGYFDDSGLWIEGRYETQVVQNGGLYQTVWVPGYWTP